MERFDYVVIGGGSGGCAAAAGLAEDGSSRVLVLESGPAAEDHPETLRADGYKDCFANDAVMQDRFTVPQKSCGGRRKYQGSGRVVGGSGSVNGMVYTRGGAEDYDEWPEGWRWRDVTPSFDAIEARLGVRPRPPTRWTEVCIRAAVESGFRRSADLSNGDLRGVLGYEPMSYSGEDRRSSYVAFVKDSPRPNLVLRSGAHVDRLAIGEGPRVIRVEYTAGGKPGAVEVGREVVLAAGALDTPKLLMLSGVGPGHELRRHGIPVIVERPELGRNFHDHPNVTLFFLGREEVDCFHPQLYGFHRASKSNGLPPEQSDTCYVFYPARSSLKEAAKRMGPTLALPASLYEVSPLRRGIRAGIDLAFASAAVRRFITRVFGIVVILGKPRSRGTVGLLSRDPRDQARLDPAWLSEPEDLDAMVEGVRLARRIAAAPSLARWGARELSPGPRNSETAEIAGWIRRAVMTTYHYAGTCRMGTDRGALVDPELRFKGIRGLRVADASVIPSAPVSALNAPSMLIGYRAAQLIRAT